MKCRIVSAMVLLAAVLPSWAFDDGDWQFWTTDAIEYKFTNQWTGRLEGECYFGDDMRDLFYRHADLGFSRKLRPWFVLGMNYRLVDQEKAGRWKQEDRPHLNGTFNWSAWGLRLSDRNRLEYRSREDASDFWRYRNRLRAGLPLPCSGLKLESFVSDEVFVDSETEELNQNRGTVGVTASLPAHLRMDLYYMLQSTKSADDWTDANILGANLTLSI